MAHFVSPLDKFFVLLPGHILKVQRPAFRQVLDGVQVTERFRAHDRTLRPNRDWSDCEFTASVFSQGISFESPFRISQIYLQPQPRRRRSKQKECDTPCREWDDNESKGR